MAYNNLIQADTDLFSVVLSLLLLLLVLIVYFLPTWIANSRSHKNNASIFVVNLFLGWTLLGWVIALAWALKND